MRTHHGACEACGRTAHTTVQHRNRTEERIVVWLMVVAGPAILGMAWLAETLFPVTK